MVFYSLGDHETSTAIEKKPNTNIRKKYTKELLSKINKNKHLEISDRPKYIKLVPNNLFPDTWF